MAAMAKSAPVWARSKPVNLKELEQSLEKELAKLQAEEEDLINENLDETIELRHWFHQNAELSNREFKTAARIAEELKKIGYEPMTGIAKTGVVAILNSGKPGPVVGIWLWQHKTWIIFFKIGISIRFNCGFCFVKGLVTATYYMLYGVKFNAQSLIQDCITINVKRYWKD